MLDHFGGVTLNALYLYNLCDVGLYEGDQVVEVYSSVGRTYVV